MKKIFFLLVVPFLTACVEQEPLEQLTVTPKSITQKLPTNEVTTEDLSRLAQSFFSDKMGHQTRSKGFSISTVYGKTGQPSLYVINFTGEQGFIVTSATKKMLPVLAYSETGHYDTHEVFFNGVNQWQNEMVQAVETSKTLPDDSTKLWRMMWRQYEAPIVTSPKSVDSPEYKVAQAIMQDSVMSWLNKGYEIYTMSDDITGDPEKNESIRELVSTGIDPRLMDEWDILSMAVVRDISTNEIVPNLIHSTWTQVSGYSVAFPPVGNREHAYAGCAPVAMGQIMRYYEHPTSFNWAKIPLTYSTPETSQLLYNIAEMADATYTEEGTSVVFEKIGETLQSYGYRAEGYNHSASLAFDNLKEGKPVIMTATYQTTEPNSKTTSHAWIASGGKIQHARRVLEVYSFRTFQKYDIVYWENLYKEQPIYYFYMNWGWGGLDNGWFIDNPLNIPDSSNSAYNRRNVVNITPL